MCKMKKLLHIILNEKIQKLVYRCADHISLLSVCSISNVTLHVSLVNLYNHVKEKVYSLFKLGFMKKDIKKVVLNRR